MMPVMLWARVCAFHQKSLDFKKVYDLNANSLGFIKTQLEAHDLISVTSGGIVEYDRWNVTEKGRCFALSLLAVRKAPVD